MQSVEREIGGVLAARLAAGAPEAATGEAPRNANRIEDFAITHMRSLAFGAAGAIVTLAGALSLSAPSAPVTPTDPVIVGSVRETPRVPTSPVWRNIVKPVELMALQAPQFARHQAQYIARASAAGDREDALLFSSGQIDMPEAKVTLRRPSTPQSPPSLFIDMTRQQAERGVAVIRAGAPGRVPAKFGDLDVADMTFQDRDGRILACLAFRSGDGGQPMHLSGWYCGAQGASVERPELTCFLDRLALLKAGEDRELRTFFAEAEQRRRPCPTARISTGRKPTWLDSDGKAPVMRGDVTGSIGKR